MKNNENIALIWEIPLAFLSFLFYKAMKFSIGNLFSVYLFLDRKKNLKWRVLSAETLKNPLGLPVLMTKGPRWNTHAIIGTVGPFTVNEKIAADGMSASMSAKSWILVVYSFPGYKTIANLSSDTRPADDRWQSLSLPPGKYTLGLRYYNWSERVTLPAIEIDGKETIKSLDCPSNVNEFYSTLLARKNWFYLSLHYYIYTLLRLRKYFPESFVKREYLPVGAPETDFFYGELKRGNGFRVEANSSILQNYDIYLNIYDRSSLPVSWCQLATPTHTYPPIENNGFYLIRVRPKSGELKRAALECRSTIKDNQTIVTFP